jgi:hypothetical protein
MPAHAALACPVDDSTAAPAPWRRRWLRRGWAACALILGLALPLSGWAGPAPTAGALRAGPHVSGGLATSVLLHDVPAKRQVPFERIVREAAGAVEGELQTRLGGRVVVHITGSEDAFRDVLGRAGARGWSEAHIDGLALLDRDIIIVRTDGGGLLRTSEVIRHELAHLTLHALAGTRSLPRWYHEGVAMRVAGEDTLDRLRRSLGDAEAFPTLTALADGLLGDRAKAEHAYVTSAAFVGWSVVRHGGPTAIPALHERIRHGLDFDNAWTATFTMPPDVLYEAWVASRAAAGSRWLTLLNEDAIWGLLGVLSGLGLFIAWLRRPRLGTGEPMDLEAIAREGERARRGGPARLIDSDGELLDVVPRGRQAAGGMPRGATHRAASDPDTGPR